MSSTLIAAPGEADKVEALCKSLVVTAKAQMAENPKLGMLAFDCSKDAYDAGVFHFWQRFSTHDKLAAFNSTPAVDAFMGKVRPMLKEPIGMVMYDMGPDGQLGHVAMPIGPKGEGGLDDATGQGGMSGGASMKQHAQVDLGKVARGDEGDSFGMGGAKRAAAGHAAPAASNGAKPAGGKPAEAAPRAPSGEPASANRGVPMSMGDVPWQVAAAVGGFLLASLLSSISGN